ncbi:hypothetical protein BU25DRAFT_7927 [Macroventuria anomochaeta]|uniref:Uncharacterized protein n=1 Tax=Macroventuria anomochaeta TaxID=301207 RepID=A0ACB6SIY9_9PLEO|nr:uncharacterized protein BU25DRAFT_7927 [Macroventuria anomochaeta]KAF2633522.1 hypothetical protein BU25DRAFT_7927 [Macroventuria anomochaeta]
MRCSSKWGHPRSTREIGPAFLLRLRLQTRSWDRFLLMLAKSPADMLPQIKVLARCGLWVKVAPPAPLKQAYSAKVVMASQKRTSQSQAPGSLPLWAVRWLPAQGMHVFVLHSTLSPSTQTSMPTLVLRPYLPTLHSRQAACISQHDVSLQLFCEIGGYAHLSSTDPLVGLFHAPAQLT